MHDVGIEKISFVSTLSLSSYHLNFLVMLVMFPFYSSMEATKSCCTKICRDQLSHKDLTDDVHAVLFFSF
jgi:hypothetical protein